LLEQRSKRESDVTHRSERSRRSPGRRVSGS
jgi:hypothetical protein